MWFQKLGSLEDLNLSCSYWQAYTLHKYLDRKKCVDTLVYWKNVDGRGMECGKGESVVTGRNKATICCLHENGSAV